MPNIKHCRLKWTEDGKLYCEEHQQYLMYLYKLAASGTIVARCQVGEDAHRIHQNIPHNPVRI